MIDYIIWLKSGESIYGTMAEEEIDRLKAWVSSSADTPGEFRDTDGTLFITSGQVAAIGVANKPQHVNSIGFKNNGQEPI